MPKNQGHNARRRANARLRHKISIQVVQTYPVYAREVFMGPEPCYRDVLATPPLFFINKETKARWLADGAVSSYCRGRVLGLNVNLSPEPQPSASMGPGILEGCWDNKPYALACAEAWRPKVRFAA